MLRSWALPRGLPTSSSQNRLAVEVDDHDLDHLTYEDADKDIADIGWWEEHDRTERRIVLTLHGRDGVRPLRADPHRLGLADAPHEGPARPRGHVIRHALDQWGTRAPPDPAGRDR